jgi:hypothetical protein
VALRFLPPAGLKKLCSGAATEGREDRAIPPRAKRDAGMAYYAEPGGGHLSHAKEAGAIVVERAGSAFARFDQWARERTPIRHTKVVRNRPSSGGSG